MLYNKVFYIKGEDMIKVTIAQEILNRIKGIVSILESSEGAMSGISPSEFGEFINAVLDVFRAKIVELRSEAWTDAFLDDLEMATESIEGNVAELVLKLEQLAAEQPASPPEEE